MKDTEFYAQTPRLILRRPTEADAPALAQARSTDFVTRYNLYQPCGADQIQKELEYIAYMATYVPPTTRPGNDTTPSPQVPSSSGWVCPVPYYTLTSPFGMRIHPVYGDERMHNGIDMAAPKGTPVYAAKSGKVTCLNDFNHFINWWNFFYRRYYYGNLCFSD